MSSYIHNVIIPGVHPFESAGLGKAPFKFLGMNDFRLQAGGLIKDKHSETGGTCDFCGRHTTLEYVIKSDDGKVFITDAECVYKSDKGNLSKEIFIQEKKNKKEKEKHKSLIPFINAVKKGILPYGKYKDDPKQFMWLAENDPDYLVWIYENAPLNPLGDAIRHRLKDTMELMVKEAIDKQKEIQKEQKKKDSQSKFVGEKGEKITRKLEIEAVIPLKNSLDTKCIVFRDSGNNKYVSYLTGFTKYSVGEKITLTFNVKEHTIYKDVKQTVIKNVKIKK